ncbi:MAG: maleylpyruvate isomerase family mycothiol-dependent enzyme [Humibacillus sp.]|nr:maleylpyruvate isomerase family mycothiol-dependent enzyme [Humibacillus sp.]MDN5777599.1 maleylpyruvate isomerase family mycothiol-dependent enzyme [Humibacillus sp.]
MPMHPAAPDDHNGMLDAFEQTVQAIIDLGWACREEEFDLPTEYGGLSVKKQLAHVVASEKALAGIPRQLAANDSEMLPYGAFARTIEADVESRSRQTGKMVLQELAAFHPERMEQLRRAELELDSIIGGPFGPDTTFGQQLLLRTIDAWTREQDLRQALNSPGDLDSAGAALTTAEILRSLPRTVARTAQIEAGHDVVFDVTGPVVAREGVRVRAGDDGRPFGVLLYSGTDRPEGQESTGVTSIRLTTEALTRRAAGRRSVDEIHFSVIGDDEVAARVLEALVLTQLLATEQ